MSMHIGVLTTGGDSPGINAALRGLGKAAYAQFDMHVLGFQDGFSGMARDMHVDLGSTAFSGILTTGGTILGTNRDRPNRVEIDGKFIDSTDTILAIYKKHHLDGLVCLGGSDAQESALYLKQKGLNVITLPVTIDNDVPLTDSCVGFSTAIEVAAEAIDRLHSTAFSHHRIIIVETMGHETGWLTLGAGLAGGADVILIPEIPYQIETVAEAITDRSKAGKRFSLIAVSEGAINAESVQFFESAHKANERLHEGAEEKEIDTRLTAIQKRSAGDTNHLANRLEQITKLETRITILGYLQRGGTPSAADRILGTQLGTACASMIKAKKFGCMVAKQSGSVVAVPLEDVISRSTVPADHPWVQGARLIGVCMGN